MNESPPEQKAPVVEPMTVPASGSIRGPVLLVLVVGASVFAVWFLWPRLTEERVQETIISTLASEAEESFYVTGVLTFSTTVEQQSDKTFLPGILNLSLGTTTATVRVPGRVTYGFNVGDLRAEHIRYNEDGVVDVEIPNLEVFSVEPELENVDIQTDVGWARLHRSSGQETERRALRAIRPTMRATAERHLANSEAPELNTAEALVRLLTPPLEAGGVHAPRFRMHLASGGILELDASDAHGTDE